MATDAPTELAHEVTAAHDRECRSSQPCTRSRARPPPRTYPVAPTPPIPDHPPPRERPRNNEVHNLASPRRYKYAPSLRNPTPRETHCPIDPSPTANCPWPRPSPRLGTTHRGDFPSSGRGSGSRTRAIVSGSRSKRTAGLRASRTIAAHQPAGALGWAYGGGEDCTVEARCLFRARPAPPRRALVYPESPKTIAITISSWALQPSFGRFVQL